MAAQTYVAVAPVALTYGQDLEHRFLRLPHPRTGSPTLFLPTAAEGAKADSTIPQQILEVQRVQPPKQRSWFIEDSVVADGSLLLFTPIDPLFLLIPVLASLLAPSSRSSRASADDSTKLQSPVDNPWLGLASPAKGSEPQYRPLDDMIADAASARALRTAPMFADSMRGAASGSGVQRGGHVGDEKRECADDEDSDDLQANEDVVRLCGLCAVREKLVALCESTDIAGETYLRPSTTAVMSLLRRKVEHLAQESVLRRFRSVRKGLAREGLGDDEEAVEGDDGAIKREDALEGEGAVECAGESGAKDAQSALTTAQLPTPMTAAQPAPPSTKTPARLALEHQARLNVACELVGQYLPASVSEALLQSFDFSALTAHHDHLASLAFALHGGGMADAEAAEDGQVKKPAGDKPGVKRKGSGSGGRGVEALKKVNTTKMRKLTTFFVKK